MHQRKMGAIRGLESLGTSLSRHTKTGNNEKYKAQREMGKARAWSLLNLSHLLRHF